MLNKITNIQVDKQKEAKIGYCQQDIRVRNKEIKNSVFKLDQFLTEEFTLHGIRNLYGEAIV